jgi:hypothetical protein
LEVICGDTFFAEPFARKDESANPVGKDRVRFELKRKFEKVGCTIRMAGPVVGYGSDVGDDTGIGIQLHRSDRLSDCFLRLPRGSTQRYAPNTNVRKTGIQFKGACIAFIRPDPVPLQKLFYGTQRGMGLRQFGI